MEIDGTIYSYPHPALMWEGDTLLTFTPPTSFDFDDGDSINVCLLEVRDSLGNPMAEPFCWFFYIDLTPPLWSFPVPLPDTIINDTLAVISVNFRDELSGIDLSSVFMVVEGDTLRAGDIGITLTDSTISYDIGATGAVFSDWDTIDVFVYSCDSPDTCGPNCSSTIWRFFIHTSGPEATILTPRPGWITACEDNCILMRLFDDFEGVDDTTIVLVINRADTFTTFDPELTFIESDSLLTFCPSSWRLWADMETVTVELISASDTLGNPLAMPLSWFFAVDITPPSVTGISPAHGDTLQCSIL